MGKTYSTREAAAKLGIALVTLQGHIRKGTFKVPPLVDIHGGVIRLWSDSDLRRAKKVLATVKRGPKPRQK
jgi:hypothetical protein